MFVEMKIHGQHSKLTYSLLGSTKNPKAIHMQIYWNKINSYSFF